jgi:hypothetical protein
LLRRREKGPIVFGTVQIPLVSSFLKAEETRYPIRGVNGVEIGEMRLSVQFQEINVLPIAEYGGVVSVAHADLEAHTAQAVADKLITNNRDGTLEPLCRIALCEGVLMEHVTRMCDEEASADGSTLFRGASPLTKTLEIMLRLMCSDFVEACLGPTIDKVVSEGIGYEGKIGPRTLAVLTELVEMTWTNMYANRHMFPNFIRGALAYLFGKVKEHHDDSVDLCYKAVSSFVFLRLFVPALMSPHLFNLANGLLPAGPRRTLSLVAKVVHQLAFFSENGALRNQELALFRPFLANNREAMIDYILSLASPGAAGAWAHPVSPKINAMAADRREVVDHFHADTIPHMTVAGAIDLGAEWAIVSESWYLRDDVDVDIAAHMDAVHFLAMDIDDGASSIARFATPPPSHHTHGLSRTAASSLTSTPRSARSARSTRSSRSIRSSAYTATDEYGDSLDAVSVGAQSTSGHSIAGSGPIVGSGSAEELSSHHVMDRRSTDVESRESADVCTDIESTNGLMTPSTSDMCSGLASLALEVATDDGLSECSGTTNMTGMTGMTGTTTEGWSKKDRKSLRLKRMRKVAAMGLDEESHNDMPFDEDKEDVIPPVPAIATWSTDWAGSGAPSLKSL